MNTLCLKRIAAALAALSLSTAALAQYIWLDEKGIKQYSDMAPPVSVPKDRILKEPASRLQPQAGAAAAPGKEEKPAVSGTAPSEVSKTAAEKNADFNKRRMEQAEKDKKAAEQAKATADKAKNCERARNYNQSLVNGERMYRTNANGEREYLSDDQRAQEMKEGRSILDACK